MAQQKHNGRVSNYVLAERINNLDKKVSEFIEDYKKDKVLREDRVHCLEKMQWKIMGAAWAGAILISIIIGLIIDHQ